MVAVKVPRSSMPSRRTIEKPDNVNVTEYIPGGSVTMRYWPAAVGDDGARLLDQGRTARFNGDTRQHGA
jgi:hypothetical protein